MTARQLDLFSASGSAPDCQEQGTPRPPRLVVAELDDDALIQAIPAGSLADGPALAREAGRRRLAAAVPVLERLCLRFSGFGVDQAIPEQAAALEALAMIGGGAAANVVARMITKRVVQGPTFPVAIASAARLQSRLPAEVVAALLQHADPSVRADACRCARAWPALIPILIELLDDGDADVRTSAACALGRLGRPEAQAALARLLRVAPTPEVIDAITPIADEESIILLARIARTRPHLAEVALVALDAIDHPRARQITAGIIANRDG